MKMVSIRLQISISAVTLLICLTESFSFTKRPWMSLQIPLAAEWRPCLHCDYAMFGRCHMPEWSLKVSCEGIYKSNRSLHAYLDIYLKMLLSETIVFCLDCINFDAGTNSLGGIIRKTNSSLYEEHHGIWKQMLNKDL